MARWLLVVPDKELPIEGCYFVPRGPDAYILYQSRQ
jgi:hypothetical protein